MNNEPEPSFKSSKPALSVSDLNRQVKRMLEVSYGQVWVSGEISGLSRPRSGHWYFTLKDDKAQIRCAMFKGLNQRLKFMPNEGDLILVRAKVSLYEGRGDYQLIVDSMEPEGLGQLQAAFEALKLKLSEEGLFNTERKKEIPSMPKKVAVITSQSGAVIHDIISVCQRRFPALEIILLPVSVQGDSASGEIAHAIALTNQLNLADVIIVGRGGGSLEDLWAFNEEVVARAIFASELPIVSAVGHEVDFTIADLVADYRAPTPSAAAEKITPDQFELMQTIDQLQRRFDYLITQKLQKSIDEIITLQSRLKHPGETLKEKKSRLLELNTRFDQAIKNRLRFAQQTLETQRQTFFQYKPSQAIQHQAQKNQHLAERLLLAERKIIEQQQHRLSMSAQTLHTASPLATLGRGYAILKSEKKKVLTSTKQLKAGDKVNATLKDGVVHMSVEQSISQLEI